MAQKIIVTHDGTFHADDVFAVAVLLTLLKGGAKVTRTRVREKIAAADYVVDVGEEYAPERNRFDHHQREGAGVRKNGIPFAAFGLVWKQYGEKIAGGRDIAEMIDTTLVQPLDARDNGVSLCGEFLCGIAPYELSDAVRALVPSWREEGVSIQARFEEAVLFAERVLTYEIERARARIEGERQVRAALETAEDKRLIFLDGDYPWKDMLARFPEPLFVVHPQDTVWYLECVRDNPHMFVNRKNLPEGWAGLRDEELAQITDVPDAVFCHRNRFMAVAKSKEGALALAKLALQSDS